LAEELMCAYEKMATSIMVMTRDGAIVES